MITIAIHHMGAEQWTAGSVVQELLLRALRTLPEPRPSLRLTVWKETPERDIAAFRHLVDGVICLPATDGKARTRLLKQNDVDVFISLPTESALDLDVARVVWMYDFQHRHYPENFPAAELQRRDRLFKAHADSADRLLIYSQAVMKDLAAFAPQSVGRARLVRFVPCIPTACFDKASAGAASRYGLPERFFFLPNHFLPHKNHAVVVEALGQLAAQGCRPIVVCTGQDKTPTAESLAARCRELGIERQFVRLGLVPREDYFLLLQQSVALINPSLFEGFGLSVAEAKYLGKQAILADIPVLHEHESPSAVYCVPGLPDEWASRIKSAWNSPSPSTHSNNDLMDRCLEDRLVFGRELLGICQDACVHRQEK